MCSNEKEVAVISAANLIKRSPFEPLNDQQFPGTTDPFKKITQL